VGAGGHAPASTPLLIGEELTMMEDIRFDALTKVLGDAASRRDALRVAMGGGLAAALGALGLGNAGAKKKGKGKNKKKCKKPKVKCKKKSCAAGQVCSGGKCTTPPPTEGCQFSKTATLWTLQADCTISKTIEIPDGVTLDGNGKTITMSGNTSGYLKEVPDDWTVAAAVLANGGNANVHDLTIRGGSLTGSCAPTGPEGLAFINTSGTIERVTVEDIALGGSFPCGSGITATGTGGQTVAIEDVTVSGCPSNGVWGLSRANTDGITINLDGANVTKGSVADQFEAAIAYEGGRVAGSIANANVSTEVGTGIYVVGRGDMAGAVVAITDVTVTNATGTGILAGLLSDGTPQTGTYAINILEAIVTCTGEPGNHFQTGILYTAIGDGADFAGTINDSIIRGGFTGIAQDGVGQLTVHDITIEESLVGMSNVGGSLDAFVNTFTDVLVGISSFTAGSLPADSVISSNTIVGGTATGESSFGVHFALGATGMVSGNTISNFFDTDPGLTSCGIGVVEDAGEVTIGENDFPDPPGNEEDICLDIPVPPDPLRARRKGKDALSIAALRQMRDRKDSLKSNGHAGRDRKHSKHKAGRGRTNTGRASKH
jgi:hypothetical protein